MLELLVSMFSYPFMVRTFVVGILISLCASLLGVSLVLKRYSMIGDGLSHVGFGALAFAAVMNLAPLAVAIPVVMAAAFLLLRLSENSKIKGDSAIAMISAGSLAFGVMLISLTSGMNVDVFNYMFGSILALDTGDVWISIFLSAAVLVIYVIFYHRIFSVTFDESFASASGVPSGFYNTLIALLTAVTVVVSMRLMGALLISSLIIFPPITAMRLCRSYRSVVIGSALISIVCFILGITSSFCFGTPAGASVVCANIIVFVLFVVIDRIRSRPTH